MTAPAEALLADLSDEQRAAVTALDGPVLILAGAGSGKTRVITYRIAYTIASGRASPDEVLALTFTNKAAREMRERVQALLARVAADAGTAPEAPSGDAGAARAPWVTTFHAFGARVMRRHAAELGYEPSFAIYDADDAARVVKRVFRDLNLAESRVTPSGFLGWLESPRGEAVELGTGGGEATSFLERRYLDIHRAYRGVLRKQNALDFRDLLLRPLELFTRFPEVRARWEERFRYILVDEYQDTNRPQYRIARILAARHGNVCAVGDEDQSIYSWRGADIANILDFESDFGPSMKLLHLLENYRSPEVILQAANSVIRRNQLTHRKEGGLVATKRGGDRITLLVARDGEEEARLVCRRVDELARSGTPLAEMAVFYRTHAQSRLLEQRLAQERIPYRVYGGTPFFGKREIKDLLAYLWVVANPRDTVSLERALQTPRRGIGEASIQKAATAADAAGLTLDVALRRGMGVGAATARRLESFFALVDELAHAAATGPLAGVAALLIERIGYREHLASEGREDREELVDEFLSLLAEFDRLRVPHEAGGAAGALIGFLEAVSLQASVDSHRSTDGALTLMTVHNAKGLEFPFVFVTGLEEKLFPHASSLDDPRKLEEERRLFYVGMTRSQRRLVLSCARQRMLRGAPCFQLPSRFLGEIDAACLEVAGERGGIALPRRPWRPAPAATIDPIYDDD
jgi:DNA helicase-2/ATP-dependent DNA helicase PcrA